jgi:RND family efflux transporter MFP subunit
MSLLHPQNRPRLAGTVLVCLSGAIGLVTLRAQSGEKPRNAGNIPQKRADSALRIETVLVQAHSASPVQLLSGQVEPYHIATLSAEVGERIVARPVEQGDRLAQGAVVALLDSRLAAAARDRAQAALAQATAARQQAETDYARARVETDAARQQARARVQQAVAGQKQAQAQVSQATAGQQKTRNYTRLQDLRQAEAALAQVKTEERLARIEHDRSIWLVKEGAAPQQTLDRTQATLDSLIARRQAAEQALSLAQEGARQEDIATAAAQVQAAEAQVRASTAQLDQAQADLRIANTRDTRLASLRRQIDSLRAQELQAQAAVRQAEIALSKHRLVAPFTGRALATLAEPGEMVAPGTPILRLGFTERVKVTFAVSEAARPGLRPGQRVTITADALPNQTFAGRIATLSFQADPRSRAFPIEVVVENPDERLLPNMVARLSLPVGESRTRLRVPISAIATDGSESYVYVVRGDRVARRVITPGAPQGDQVEITRGLASGERIAATPQRLTNGARVRFE